MRAFSALLSLLLCIHISFAQIPAGYYDNAFGLSGTQLKDTLHSIIKGHQEYPYTSGGTDVWDLLKQTDQDPQNPANIILFYTGLSVNAAQEYNGGNGWNREHVWSKSRGDFGTSPGPGTDAHNIRPCNPSVNSAKSNRWFDNGSTPYLLNGTPTGCLTGNTNWVWEPRDEVKGDVARIIFYMATRYESSNGEPDLEVIDYFPLDVNTKDPVYAKLSTLILWHLMDTVDSFERNRNNVIYGFQQNRNPYIDHPEFVSLIWNITDIHHERAKAEISIYPNPCEDQLRINGIGLQKVEIFDLQGKSLHSANSALISIQHLPQGLYILKVHTSEGIFSRKLIHQ